MFKKNDKKSAIATIKQYEHQVEPAFKLNGTQYYNFKNFTDMPAERALMVAKCYEEHKAKVSFDYLKLHLLAVREILRTVPVIDVFKLYDLNEQLLERLERPADLALIYKCASIVFFDDQEVISNYDTDYNLRKIQSWQQYDADRFFALKPLIELFPILANSTGGLQSYAQVCEKINHLQLHKLLTSAPKVAEGLQDSSHLSVIMGKN